MTETLLTSSSIKLFGRTVHDLTYNYDTSTTFIGSNNFLRNQLNFSINISAFTGQIAAATLGQITGVKPANGTNFVQGPDANFAPGMPIIDPTGTLAPNTVISSIVNDWAAKTTVININPVSPAAVASGTVFSVKIVPNFARIYAFSFEGAIYTMPKPAILLVHGPGQPLDGGGNRTTTDQSGVIAREWEFASPTNQDLRYWEYEKGDFSLRLEPEAGPLEQILLQAVARSGADRADRAGAGLEVRSGAGLSGAGVSGAGVSGAGVSGAGLSGAGLRR